MQKSYPQVSFWEFGGLNNLRGVYFQQILINYTLWLILIFFKTLISLHLTVYSKKKQINLRFTDKTPSTVTADRITCLCIPANISIYQLSYLGFPQPTHEIILPTVTEYDVYLNVQISPSSRPTRLVSVTVRWTCRREGEHCCTMTSLLWPTSPASTAAPASPAKASDISTALIWLCVGKRWEAVILMTLDSVKLSLTCKFNLLCLSYRAEYRLPVWTMWQRVGGRSEVMFVSPLWFPLTSGARAWCPRSLFLLVTRSSVRTECCDQILL